jgi:hypothetical protein
VRDGEKPDAFYSATGGETQGIKNVVDRVGVRSRSLEQENMKTRLSAQTCEN